MGIEMSTENVCWWFVRSSVRNGLEMGEGPLGELSGG